jgi:TRAP transporter TAXI family solute receptor
MQRPQAPITAVLAAALALGAGAFAGASAANDEFFTIGTGGVTGVYYPAGGAICRFVNRQRDEHGLRCSVESTGGSVYNLNTLRKGDLDFGVVQSDWQYYAFKGESRFADQGPFEDLRAVFSLHPEPFTVVARAGAGIEHFDDLEGKRVNVGNPGSGQRANMEELMALKGWTMDDFALAAELKPAEMARALCDNKIDAFVYVVGHPSGAIKEAATTCDVKLVDVDGAAAQQLIEENPFYRRAVIPGGMYAGTAENTVTYGVGATLVTSARVDDSVVHATVRAVFENLEQFKSLHPAFGVLEPGEMVRDGLSAPLHPGARRYYEEAGLLEE